MTTRALADTSVFIADGPARPLDSSALPDELAISIITIGELRVGVLAADDLDTREVRLRTLTSALAFDPVPIDNSVAEQWTRLRALLHERNVPMGVNDSWIAATAMALEVPLLTRNEGFPTLDDLEVRLV